MTLALAGALLLGLATAQYLNQSERRERYQELNSLQFSQRRFDLGSKKPGETEVFKFTVENVSKHPIESIIVLSSCGCTSTKRCPRRLDKGQSADVEFEWSALALCWRSNAT